MPQLGTVKLFLGLTVLLMEAAISSITVVIGPTTVMIGCRICMLPDWLTNEWILVRFLVSSSKACHIWMARDWLLVALIYSVKIGRKVWGTCCRCLAHDGLAAASCLSVALRIRMLLLSVNHHVDPAIYRWVFSCHPHSLVAFSWTCLYQYWCSTHDPEASLNTWCWWYWYCLLLLMNDGHHSVEQPSKMIFWTPTVGTVRTNSVAASLAISF